MITRKTATETRTRAKFSRLRVVLRNLAVAQFLALIYCQTFAQQTYPTGPQVEASVIYNVGKFVTWPADRGKSGAFQICILGKDPFGATIDSMVSGESVSGKKIEMRRLRAVRQAQKCMILFISASQEKHLPAILVAARNFCLLTVSDMYDFAERGGDVGLVLEREHVHFEVNRAAVQDDHLVVSSELLKVATKVIGKQ